MIQSGIYYESQHYSVEPAIEVGRQFVETLSRLAALAIAGHEAPARRLDSIDATVSRYFKHHQLESVEQAFSHIVNGNDDGRYRIFVDSDAEVLTDTVK